MIQITKDSGRKQRYLKRIIIVLLIVMGISMVTFGSIVCKKLRQPQNYIEAVDSDSIEMKIAELLSGIDGTMMFQYNSRDTFKTLSIYLSEYQLGQRVSHKKVLELSYEDVKSSTNGWIVITPDFDNFTAKLIRVWNRARISSTDLWGKRVKFVANTGYCRGAYQYR